ncbi:invasion associated locus B family protein [Sinisalibacter lacisalsi]|uniref:Uncharacterized protein n=1 Tax=Sinisalibacter lacisalsi TaxID=1526570 RepID=A0ABQ1QNL2_9RHOB|nr:invasion associated locus B family protein [Sinisalibacter lacisalsi]GGD36182.1 hypothetical protein GCM10011358_19990 [Sinisalibacter lacisalsi]
MSVNAKSGGNRVTPRLAYALALTALLPWAAPALATQDVLRQFQDWSLHATGGGCRMVSTVVSRTSGAVLLEASFQRDTPVRDAGALLVALQVPLGVHLPAGIALRHPDDGKTAIGLEWISCGAKMCTAVGRLSGEAVARLRRARSVFVGFQPMAGARPVNIELSLMGFTAASRAMADCS